MDFSEVESLIKTGIVRHVDHRREWYDEQHYYKKKIGDGYLIEVIYEYGLGVYLSKPTTKEGDSKIPYEIAAAIYLEFLPTSTMPPFFAGPRKRVTKDFEDALWSDTLTSVSKELKITPENVMAFLSSKELGKIEKNGSYSEYERLDYQKSAIIKKLQRNYVENSKKNGGKDLYVSKIRLRSMMQVEFVLKLLKDKK